MNGFFQVNERKDFEFRIFIINSKNFKFFSKMAYDGFLVLKYNFKIVNFAVLKGIKISLLTMIKITVFNRQFKDFPVSYQKWVSYLTKENDLKHSIRNSNLLFQKSWISNPWFTYTEKQPSSSVNPQTFQILKTGYQVFYKKLILLEKTNYNVFFFFNITFYVKILKLKFQKHLKNCF